MDSETRTGLIKTTAGYLFLAFVLLILSYGSTLTIGEIGSFLPYLPETLTPVGVYILFIPILVGVTLLYLAILVGTY